MERRVLRILFLLVTLIAVLIAVGFFGFMALGIPPGKAFSGTINILTSVGLGSPPADTASAWFIIGILQVGSVIIVAMAVANLSQALLSGELKQYMGRKRMDERIKQLKDHSIIAGYSLTGASLAKDLIAEDKTFVVVERDPETILKLEENGLLYVEGNATNEDVLKSAGIERAKALFAVLSADSDNLMVVLSARGLNEKLKIVSRITRDEYHDRFLRAGADAAISPQEWASRRMAQAVFRPSLLQLLSSLLDPTVSHAYLEEVKVPQGSHAIGKSLADSRLRKSSGIVILGIARSTGECVSSPGPETMILEGDVLIGYGERDNFANLSEFLQTEPPPSE